MKRSDQCMYLFLAIGIVCLLAVVAVAIAAVVLDRGWLFVILVPLCVVGFGAGLGAVICSLPRVKEEDLE